MGPRGRGGGGGLGEGEEERVRLQAVVIADSFEQRFRPATFTRPKALQPLAGIPMLDYVLAWLAANNVDEVFVFCCAHAELVMEHVEKYGGRLAGGAAADLRAEHRPHRLCAHDGRHPRQLRSRARAGGPPRAEEARQGRTSDDPDRLAREPPRVPRARGPRGRDDDLRPRLVPAPGLRQVRAERGGATAAAAAPT